jgi:hypothetical protein
MLEGRRGSPHRRRGNDRAGQGLKYLTHIINRIAT